MLPPIKRPTKRTQDILKVRSAPSDAPTPWSSEIRLGKGFYRDPKPTPLKKHVLKSTADEVALLEAIATYPGRAARFYAKQIKRSYNWTIRVLGEYEADGVVEGYRETYSLLWRLT